VSRKSSVHWKVHNGIRSPKTLLNPLNPKALKEAVKLRYHCSIKLPKPFKPLNPGAHLQDPKALKEAVKVLYQKHVTEAIKPAELDADILQEYGRQREYLEKTVGAPLHPLFNLILFFGRDLGRRMGLF
jgi:hypothetical protein